MEKGFEKKTNLVERKGWFYSCSIKRIVNFLHLDCTWQNGKWRQLLINIHYSVIKWWSEDNFSLVCNLFSRSTVYLWKVIISYHFILGSTEYLREVVFIYHIILGSTVYFWEVVFIYHFILGSSVYLWEIVFIYHFFMYNQGEENVTILFIT